MPIVIAEELEVGQPLPGWHDRYFHSDSMSFEYDDVDEGSSIHEHFHVEEEVWHVVKGAREITLNGQRSLVSAGNAAIVPSNTKHSVVALTNAKVIIANHPVRERIVRHSWASASGRQPPS
jgi:quercetin dioxygenase-like cupin family protein